MNTVEFHRKSGDGYVVFAVLYTMTAMTLYSFVSLLELDIPMITPVFLGLIAIGGVAAWRHRSAWDRLFFPRPLIRMTAQGLSIKSLGNVEIAWNDIEQVEFHQTIDLEAEEKTKMTNEHHYGNPLKTIRLWLKNEDAYIDRLSSTTGRRAHLNRFLGAQALEFSCSNLDARAADILNIIKERAPHARLTQAVGESAPIPLEG